jgi:ArsR family transcriptional regulator
MSLRYNVDMDGMRDIEQLFKGLADVTRLRILNLLLHGELCVCDIQYVLDSAQPNISRHLMYMKNSGLVLDRREGQRIYYKLVQPTEGARRQLFAYLRASFSEIGEFAQDSRKLKKAIDTGSCTVSEWSPYSALVTAKTPGTSRPLRTHPNAIQSHITSKLS